MSKQETGGYQFTTYLFGFANHASLCTDSTASLERSFVELNSKLFLQFQLN